MNLNTFLVLLLVVLERNLDTLSANSRNKHRLPKKHGKRKFYICPPNYIRFNHKCYLFNDKLLPWKNAYFECQKRFGFLAIIDSYTENRNLQTFLARQRKMNKLQNGYWIGGIYNWKLKTWKWADNNRQMKFKGFQNTTKLKSSLDWNCIMIGPKTWRPKLCTKRQKFICEAKIQRVNRSERKVLKEKYRQSLNEIPVVDLDLTRTINFPKKPEGWQLLAKKHSFTEKPTVYHSRQQLRMQQKTLAFRNFHNDNSLHPNFVLEEHNFL